MSDENIIGTSTTAAVPPKTCNDLFSQGDILFWQCEYEKAKEYFEQILNQPSITLIHSARCYNSLGAVNAELKNYDEALNNYHKHLAILEKLETPETRKSDIAKCHISIGKIYSLKEDYVGAIDWYQQALSVLSTINSSSDLISNIHHDLANLYTKTKQFDLAEKHFTTALEMDRQQLEEDHPKFGQTYANMGVMYYCQEDYKQALKYFFEAQRTWQKFLPASHVYIDSMEKTIRKVESKLGMYIQGVPKVMIT
ncbi:unnamed protein product [Rotaria sp. Silwood2]|nr:unnamed protein product [Rotaria sp. Silwood2]CAF4668569.1 unnamed protein product [Rotaria sp. Silwood2]